MGRKIEFMIWDTEKNQWFKPTYEAYKNNLEDIHINLDGSLLLRYLDSVKHESTFPNRFIKVQYTELNDKNKKEIYEDFIIRDKDNVKRIVKYHKGSYWAERINPNYDDGDLILLSDCNALSEIIGNIYENGELLKKETLKK